MRYPATYELIYPSAECHPLSKVEGRCGPDWGGRCNKNLADYSLYCNLLTGWCGTTAEHKDAHPDDTYDWKTETCSGNS